MTVTVDACNSEHAAGSVINYSRSTVDLYIEVQFLDAGGTVLDDGIDNVRGVRPRESALWDAGYFGGRMVASCRANVSSAFAQ